MKPTHSIHSDKPRSLIVTRVTIPDFYRKPDRVKWVFLALLIACLTLFAVHARLSHKTAAENIRMIEELTDALEESTHELEKRPPAKERRPAFSGIRPGERPA